MGVEPDYNLVEQQRGKHGVTWSVISETNTDYHFQFTVNIIQLKTKSGHNQFFFI